jgi:hypothetical protein
MGSALTNGPSVTTGGPPREWGVQIVKREGDVLGAGLGNTDNGAVIFNIQENGLLDAWNRTQLSNPLRPGFIITEVNGAVGYWDILEEVQRPGVLDMRVSAEPPSGSGPNWFREAAEMGRSFEEKWSFEPQGDRSPMLRLHPQDEYSSLPTVRAADCGVDQCAICIDDVGPNDSLLLLPCNHAYHPLCVARWLTQGTPCGSSRHSCPLCCRRMINSREGIVAVGADDPSASWPLSRPRRFHSRRSTR